MDELIQTLKQQIIEALELENIKPEDIDDNAPLFGDGLGLDSIDVFELCYIMKYDYGILLKDPSLCNEVFRSVTAMASFIEKNKTK